jgi:hypothetical protein
VWVWVYGCGTGGVSGWLSLPLLGRKRSTRLVGYAHAITDNALVATVLDVRVAREFRDAGVGRVRVTNIIISSKCV